MILKDETKRIEKFLRETNKLLNKHTKDNLKDYGLTLPRFHVLLMIAKLKPVNMSKLHHKMFMANSTLTVIVDHLVDDKLVKRYRDEDDRRVVLIETTLKGEKILEDLLNVRQNFLQEALFELEPENRELLGDMLEPVLKSLRKQLAE